MQSANNTYQNQNDTKDIAPFTLANCWAMWGMNCVLAWGPIVIISSVLHSGLLRTILLTLAVIWLFSASSTARFSPIARNFPELLFVGGIGFCALGFMNPNSMLALLVFAIVALIFVITPSYCKFAETEQAKASKFSP